MPYNMEIVSWPKITATSPSPRSTQPCTLCGKVKPVSAKGRWCYAAGKVTKGQVESNGSLSADGWLKSPAGWLPVHQNQLRAQRLETSMESPYLAYTSPYVYNFMIVMIDNDTALRFNRNECWPWLLSAGAVSGGRQWTGDVLVSNTARLRHGWESRSSVIDTTLISLSRSKCSTYSTCVQHVL